jgi:hypothetical protein
MNTNMLFGSMDVIQELKPSDEDLKKMRKMQNKWLKKNKIKVYKTESVEFK